VGGVGEGISEDRKAPHAACGGRPVTETLTPDGFFAQDNLPAWDTWVWYAEDRHPNEPYWQSCPSYLIVWVPHHLASPADEGVLVNPEECIRWAANEDTVFTRRLRPAC
jgi:hypothetical protein